MKPNHFQAVFRAIDSDGSGMITKKELKILLEKYKVEATPEEINMMIEVCSQDAQKVKIKDSYITSLDRGLKYG